ncbi:MAG: exodeoxyribonuclease VII small subunit [Clostridia bacterium]|nr:exodeoxyribonuclease VII small subunit [Clostridia bacterium]MBR6745036.1 exodeoxyribonuclease VII small subunit [Clostridia bacterium]
MAERKKKTFESSLARLEEIVKAMESGDAMLDESLSLYEEGVKLIQFCTKALDDAEQKVKILQKGEEGALVEVDFIKTEGSAQ